MIKVRRLTLVTPTVTPVTPVTPVTARNSVTTVTHCETCGQRLPANTRAAAKQKAYRARKKARQ